MEQLEKNQKGNNVVMTGVEIKDDRNQLRKIMENFIKDELEIGIKENGKTI